MKRGGARACAADVERGPAGETLQFELPETLRRIEVLSAKPLDVSPVRPGRLQINLGAGYVSVVNREHFSDDDRGRPSVEQQMMMTPNQFVLIIREPDKRDPHKRRFTERESTSPVGFEKVIESGVCFVSETGAPIDVLPFKRHSTHNNLGDAAEVFPAERGSQQTVPVNNSIPGLSENLRLQFAAQPATELLEVFLRARFVQNVEQQSLLHRRQRVSVFQIGIASQQPVSLLLGQ